MKKYWWLWVFFGAILLVGLLKYLFSVEVEVPCEERTGKVSVHKTCTFKLVDYLF